MKRFLALTLTLALTVAAFAEEYPQIRRDHPRMFFNADTWPAIKARTQKETAAELKKLLKAVDKLPDTLRCSNIGPLNIKYGKQPDGTFISRSGTSIKGIREFGKEAAECALAWRFTGEEKYLAKAKYLLKESVRGYTVATDNRRPVDWYAYGRINALCAYDWIYEALTDAERREIIVPMVQHVENVQPEAGLDIPRQPVGNKTTGAYGMSSLLWYSGLAADGDGYCDELARKHLEKGYKALIDVVDWRNLSSGDDGGMSTTALNYCMGLYAFGHFNFFFTYSSATGKNFAERCPDMALFPNFIWWNWILDAETPKHVRYAGQADAFHDINYVQLTTLYEHLSEYLHFFKDVDPVCARLTLSLRNLLPHKKTSGRFPAVPFLLEKKFNVEPLSKEELENRTLHARHFENLGLVEMRSAWTQDATYCTYTAGAKVIMHKHYDENNFSIYKYDHLALDTGERGKQNDLNLSHYYAQSVAHNVVLLHAPNEPLPPYWGPKSDDPKDLVNYGGQINHTSAKVLAFETNDDYSYVASNAAESYGPKCTEMVRQFVYVHPDFFIVYDRVGSADPSYRKEWLLHTQQEPLLKKNTASAVSGGGKIFCQTLLPENAQISKVGGPGKEYWVNGKNFEINPKVVKSAYKKAERAGRGPYFGAWRLEVSPEKPSADDRFLHVISVGGEDMSSAVKAKLLKDKDRDGVTLTIKGKKMTFWFNRNGEVGGQVVIGKTVKPLATNVQPQKGVIL